MHLTDDDGYISIAAVTTIFQYNRGYGDIEKQMLVIFSWAVRIHELQGCTLSSAVIEIGLEIFPGGQYFVALTQVKFLEGMALCDINSKKVLNHPHDNRALSVMTKMRYVLIALDSFVHC